MTDREKLERSLDEIQDAIGYMERRMARTAVNKVTDTVLLRVCNAVKLLLESRIQGVTYVDRFTKAEGCCYCPENETCKFANKPEAKDCGNRIVYLLFNGVDKKGGNDE